MGEKSRAQGNSSDPRGSQQGRGASSVTRETAGRHCICIPTKYPQNTAAKCQRAALYPRSFVCGQEVRVFVLAVGLGTHGQPFRQLEHTGKSLDTQPKV